MFPAMDSIGAVHVAITTQRDSLKVTDFQIAVSPANDMVCVRGAGFFADRARQRFNKGQMCARASRASFGFPLLQPKWPFAS